MRRRKKRLRKQPVIFLFIIVFIIMYFMSKKKVLLDVEPVSQYPDYPTGCESVSLYMLLKYYNVDVSIDKIIEELPKGPLPYGDGDILEGANPEKEFVGSPLDENSYGVLSEPIRITANKFKDGAKTKTGTTIKDIRKILKSGNPMIAWFTTNLEEGIVYKEKWLDYETGEIIKWPSYEHAILITGIDNKNVYYNNPNTGKKEKININIFKKIFDMIDGRIVYYES